MVIGARLLRLCGVNTPDVMMADSTDGEVVAHRLLRRWQRTVGVKERERFAKDLESREVADIWLRNLSGTRGLMVRPHQVEGLPNLVTARFDKLLGYSGKARIDDEWGTEPTDIGELDSEPKRRMGRRIARLSGSAIRGAISGVGLSDAEESGLFGTLLARQEAIRRKVTA